MDRRRVTGPTESYVPIMVQKEEKGKEKKEKEKGKGREKEKEKEVKKPGLVDSKGKRMDQRLPIHVRSAFLKTGVISQANGSSYIELGNTKVICAVYGPRQSHRQQEFTETGKLQCEFKFATFSCENQRKSFVQDAEEKEFSMIVEHALEQSVRLELFPKAVVDIFVTVLQNDGSALEAGISCASMALADAGIEMYDLVAACSVGTNEESQTVVDISEKEVQYLKSKILISAMGSLNEVTHMVMSGEIGGQELTEAIQLGLDGSSKIHQLMQACLKDSIEEKKQQQKKKKRKFEEDK